MPTGFGDEKLWLCPTLDDSANDLSGNGNHCTYNGGMGTIADTSNGGTRAYDFDGVDDYIRSYDSGINGSGGWANFIGQGTFSVAMWYRVDPYIGGVNGAPFWGTRSRGGYYGYWGSAQPISNNNTWHYRFSSTDNFNVYYDASSSSTGDTNWHHICWSVTSNTSQLFIDGTLDSTLTPSTSPSQSIQTSLYFGRLKNWIYLNGKLDDIRIFDRPLTTTEITHLATSRGIEGNPYDFNGLGDEKLWLCPSLDDSADDISGNGNHGTYNGGMGTVADTSNGGTKAYSFDGLDDRIECSASVIGSEPIFSVSCWAYVNVHDFSYGEGLVTQFGAGTNSSTCKFAMNASNGASSSIFPAVNIRPSTTNVNAVSTNAISAQSWHHFCMVADGSTIYNYVDGVLEASTAYTGSVRSVTNPFVVGTYNQLINSNHYLNGRIDDVRAFDRALTTTEITALASKRGYEVPATSTAYHPFAALNHPLAQ